jgi:hypothetical protein
MSEFQSAPQFVRIDPLTDDRWDAFLQAQPDARIWHSSAWLGTLQRAFDYTGAHLACVVDGTLTGVLPLLLVESRVTGRRLVSLPFSGPSGPIATSRIALAGLVQRASELTAELCCRYMDIRTCDDGKDVLNGLDNLQPYVWSVMPLQGSADQIWRGVGRGIRTDVRRARRLGVTVTSSNDKHDLKAFYGLFVKTSQKHGVPPQPYRAFDIMWDVMKPRGMLHLFIARFEKTIVNALLVVSFKDIVTALYIGTDYRFLRYQPVKLTYWTAIRWACESGNRFFDLGVTHVNNESLRWFKRSFGAAEHPVTYAYCPQDGPAGTMRGVFADQTSGVGSLLRAAVRQLPPGVLHLLGRLLWKHMA